MAAKRNANRGKLFLSCAKIFLRKEELMIKSINYKGVNVDVSEDGTICIEGKQKQIYCNHDGYPCVSLL